MSGPFDMITCSGKTSIPLPRGRSTLYQHQCGLINVDDETADGHEIQKVFPMFVASVLNAKEVGTNGHFAESNGVQDHNLTEPSPFHRAYKLRQREKAHVVAKPRVCGYRLQRLSRYGGELSSLISSNFERRRAHGSMMRLTKVSIAQK